MDSEYTKVSKVECLGEIDDYVYDLSIKDHDPFFFANDILVHNTDSVYFTAYPTLKEDIDNGKLEWSKDLCIKLYDNIADQVNESFPQFMEQNFHATRKNGSIIKAGRELISDRGIFIKKKKYALNIYDKEGKRLDVNGKRGKIKAMGLDLKRSDTPKYIQEFLMEVLDTLLAGGNKETLIEMITDFKRKLREQPSWTKGSPKAVNKMTYYSQLETNSDKGKANMPGHVRAALNWNFLRRMNNDNYSMSIMDGMKVVVCKLRSNALNLTSIAYPVDELRLPEWFKTLPFDDEQMETLLVDQKIDNMMSVLNWDIGNSTNVNSTINDLFTFD